VLTFKKLPQTFAESLWRILIRLKPASAKESLTL